MTISFSAYSFCIIINWIIADGTECPNLFFFFFFKVEHDSTLLPFHYFHLFVFFQGRDRTLSKFANQISLFLNQATDHPSTLIQLHSFTQRLYKVFCTAFCSQEKHTFRTKIVPMSNNNNSSKKDDPGYVNVLNHQASQDLMVKWG